jgi:hypothetical protein
MQAMASSEAALGEFEMSNALAAGDYCPICGQPIPDKRRDEMRRRLDAHDQALSDAAVTAAARQFVAARAQVEEANRQATELVREALERDRIEARSTG